ncbi:hypothetical protein AB0N31_17780 [Streptomyces sp. NPDC051051]|uniref:hypothetical protein n=1 Tax=Streptomyces sp. NPDC051051 TaxID=3155666 RepID=UPI003421B0F5
MPAAPAAPVRRPSPHEAFLHGEDSRLVRPYLLAHEQRAQATPQRARRRTFWIAVHGVDGGQGTSTVSMSARAGSGTTR